MLAKNGVKIVAPAFFILVKLYAQNRIMSSEYSIAAKKAGLDIISWSFDVDLKQVSWLPVTPLL